MNADAAPAPESQSVGALDHLRDCVRAISHAPPSEPAQILIDALFEKFPGAAVLFYGSGASIAQHDDPAGIVFDFYVIGRSYDDLHASGAARLANKLVPPNVYYIETPSRFGVLRAKYAVLAIDHFEKLVSAETIHSYFWARFTQPCRIHAPDHAMRARLETALATAIVTFCKRAATLPPQPFTARELWLAGLGASYKAELRAEDEARAAKLIDAYGGWTDKVTVPALGLAGLGPNLSGGAITLGVAPGGAFAWRLRALQGAVLSVLRLLKGARTFDGGIDYIAWKIKRHSGVDLEITDWERAHPMLAAPGAALRYYRLRAAMNKSA